MPNYSRVDGAEIALMSFGNGDDGRSVITSANSALSEIAPGAILVDHRRRRRSVARKCVGNRAEGIPSFDAPVSGGRAGAETAEAHDDGRRRGSAFAEAEGVIATYARASTLIGASGTSN